MSHVLPRPGRAAADRSLQGRDRGPLIATLALALALTVAGVGVIVDFSTASQTRTSLDAIADAATLAGVSSTALAATIASGQREERLQAMMQRDFDAQVDSRHGLRESLKATSFTVAIRGETISATTCYRAEQPTLFSRFLGQEPIGVMSCASATSTRQESKTIEPPADGAESAPVEIDPSAEAGFKRASEQRRVRLLR